MSDRIGAVVISYNCLSNIMACVAALRAQTRRPDLLLVVDNGSTDGTREWLAARSDVCAFYQNNVGSGGAIRRGLNFLLEHGFDWGWCLDDDAHPAPGALAALCRAIVSRPEARVFNSIGVPRTDPNRFAVGALWARLSPDNYLVGRRCETLAQLGPYIDGFGMVDSIGGHFYQGVLVHRSVIQTVGAPLPWLFLGGGEIEYGLRIMRAGHHIYSVLDSIVWHPRIPFASLHLFGRTKRFEIRSSYRRYFLIRNAIWIHRTYYASNPLLPYAARRVGGALLAELFIIPGRSPHERLAGCRAALRGLADGVRLQPARDAGGREILA